MYKYEKVPIIPKFLSAIEYELIKLFNSMPSIPAKYMKIYMKLGKFPLEKFINTNIITLQEDLKINELKPTGSYKG